MPSSRASSGWKCWPASTATGTPPWPCSTGPGRSVTSSTGCVRWRRCSPPLPGSRGPPPGASGPLPRPPRKPRPPRTTRRTEMQTDVVTGACGDSGAAIARELLAAGHGVRTLTGHGGRATAQTPIDVRPLDFADPDGLTRDLTGAHTLYCTYWIRFPHNGVTHDTAVANLRTVFDAAARAGIQRIVHVSITHADLASPYPYFRGKAAAERYLASVGVGHAIVRPAILFGGDGVLLNNIAWLLRRLLLFAIGGPGDYLLRPTHVSSHARLCRSPASGAETVTGGD